MATFTLQLIAFLIVAPMAWAALLLIGRGVDRLIHAHRVRAEAEREYWSTDARIRREMIRQGIDPDGDI